MLLCVKNIRSTSHILTYLIFTESYDGSTIIIVPILLIRKLRQNKIRSPKLVSGKADSTPR